MSDQRDPADEPARPWPTAPGPPPPAGAPPAGPPPPHAPPSYPPQSEPWYPPSTAGYPPPAAGYPPGVAGRAPSPPYPMHPYGPPPRTNSNAIVALVLGIAGLTVCQPLGIVAIFLGRSARKEIAESNGTQGGDGMALAGFVLGIVSAVVLGLVVLVIGVAFLVALLSSAADS